MTTKVLSHIVVEFFHHLEKGESFTSPATGTELLMPGDAIVAKITVHDSVAFAVSLCTINQASEPGTVGPHHFEAALRGMLASLAKHTGSPQDPSIISVDEGGSAEIN